MSADNILVIVYGRKTSEEAKQTEEAAQYHVFELKYSDPVFDINEPDDNVLNQLMAEYCFNNMNNERFAGWPVLYRFSSRDYKSAFCWARREENARNVEYGVEIYCDIDC